MMFENRRSIICASMTMVESYLFSPSTADAPLRFCLLTTSVDPVRDCQENSFYSDHAAFDRRSFRESTKSTTTSRLEKKIIEIGICILLNCLAEPATVSPRVVSIGAALQNPVHR
mmetsp:Transcript_14335/g.33371  ORF Transcript_14335/g.33371 Transcript_14335/m.33371 type:complete len:115 (-) Transcript_14335:1737-2081(-)